MRRDQRKRIKIMRDAYKEIKIRVAFYMAMSHSIWVYAA